ncbi:MAG TPA: hypothetical protein VIJ61_09775 [Thermoanaerobaculia bacterium]
MDWQEQHRQRIAAFPEDVRGAHLHSSQHRAEIGESSLCGCFYCCSTFPPSEIEEWVDKNAAGEGQTALCPRCGIDSVIGDRSGFPVTKEFLEKMKAHWFSEAPLRQDPTPA